MSLQLQKGVCSNPDCPKRTEYIGNRTKMLCLDCNAARLTRLKDKAGKPKPKQLSRKSKPTGEAVFFLVLAQQRPHRCFVCNEPLVPITFSSMAHVLSKKQYPLFRLYDKCIRFLCPPMSENKCHHKWDFVAHSDLKKDPNFDKMFLLEAELKEEYSQLKNKTNE